MTSLCAVCHRSMTDTVSGQTFAGVQVKIEGHAGGRNFMRVYPELTLPLNIEVCWVCWLRALGVSVPSIIEVTN